MGGKVGKPKSLKKEFKVRREGSNQRYGIAAENLTDLLEKSCSTFKLLPVIAYVCKTEDGTTMDEEYFTDLKQNTELVIVRRERQTGSGGHHKPPTPSSQDTASCLLTEILDLMKQLEGNNSELMEAKNCVTPTQIKQIQDFILRLDGNIQADKRVDDKKWFEGLDGRFKSKSQYMKHLCASRIRSYLTNAKQYTTKLETDKDEYKNIMKEMHKRLKQEKFNEHYFNREEDMRRLCDKDGLFECQGAFDKDSCSYKHSINPYANKESRDLFSSWNFDHKIEKRIIFPALEFAIENRNNRQINSEYFYRHLFTMDNIKLVQKMCHNIKNHRLSCNESMYYVKETYNR